MKKSLFALAFIACFAFGASECEKFEKECNDGNMESCYKAGLLCEMLRRLNCLKKLAMVDVRKGAFQRQKL